MKEYERKSNTSTLSFGNKPFEYVSRKNDQEELIKRIESEPPLYHCFIITEVRGSGKRVMLTCLD